VEVADQAALVPNTDIPIVNGTEEAEVIALRLHHEPETFSEKE
jgi:hypothetical protein